MKHFSETLPHIPFSLSMVDFTGVYMYIYYSMFYCQEVLSALNRNLLNFFIISHWGGRGGEKK